MEHAPENEIVTSSLFSNDVITKTLISDDIAGNRIEVNNVGTKNIAFIDEDGNQHWVVEFDKKKPSHGDTLLFYSDRVKWIPPSKNYYLTINMKNKNRQRIQFKSQHSHGVVHFNFDTLLRRDTKYDNIDLIYTFYLNGKKVEVFKNSILPGKERQIKYSNLCLLPSLKTNNKRNILEIVITWEGTNVGNIIENTKWKIFIQNTHINMYEINSQ